MDFLFKPDEDAFRKELRDYLDEKLPSWWGGIFVEANCKEAWGWAHEFCKDLAKKGWLTMSWPKEYGGQEASHWKRTIFGEEMWTHEEPRGTEYMNVNWIGPSIMLHGTPEQKKKFLPRISRGEIIWCQGFSEPDAGSDLASLKTRATEDGDEFVVNGQKIWTSFANGADYIYLTTRTDPTLPKHAGLTVFLVDMKTPGITVRPIKAMLGPYHLNEVFFENARIPKSCMLGEKNKGWEVITAALNFERTGAARYARSKLYLDQLVEFCKTTKHNGKPLSENPAIRQKLAQAQINYEVAKLLVYRVISMQDKGVAPRFEASLGRIHVVLLCRQIGDLGVEILNLYGQLKPGDKNAPLKGMIEHDYNQAFLTTVAVGALEIQKNIIARGLGLPKGS